MCVCVCVCVCVRPFVEFGSRTSLDPFLATPEVGGQERGEKKLGSIALVTFFKLDFNRPVQSDSTTQI